MGTNINDFSMDFFSLKGKKAIVTGGNSGLGQAFALALAKAGADIFVLHILMMTEHEEIMKNRCGVKINFHAGRYYRGRNVRKSC